MEPICAAIRARSARQEPASQKRQRRIDAPAPLALWHLASFDAPTVAAVWSLAFAWAAGVHLPLWTPALLALVAWSVYIGDRLLDARTGLRGPAMDQLRERHYFHWRHRRVLIPLAAAAALAAAGIVLTFMPLGARAPNSLLAAAALAYFSGVHAGRKLPRLVTKEFLVGTIFTAGCALPTWLRLRGHAAGTGLLLEPAVYFAALAWLNCLAIGRWESAARQGRIAGVWRLGSRLALVGFVAGFVLAWTAAAHPRAAALLAAGGVSALLLALLDKMRERFTPLALRALADLVLLTPVLLAVFRRFPA